MKNLKVCYIAPEGGGIDSTPRRSSDEAAAAERVDNVRVTPIRGNPLEAAVEKRRLWQNGRRLRVRFLDGETAVMERVMAIAREWEELTNLTLSFVTSGSADIRISFREKGFSWSTVGTDALTVPASQPTMNYGWLTPSTALTEYRRVVRHEFGHALGMIHEHQNPDALGKIPWDKPKVYAYYAQQGWTEEDVDFNIFDVYDRDDTNFSEYDPMSIMHYAIPEELTVGDFSVGWNTEFSDFDRSFMATQYPEAFPGVVEIGVGSGAVAADLSVGSEVDVFRFAVASDGTHIMSTTGQTDVVLTLHGPDDQGAMVTWDDDRGRGRNARIVRKLGVGDYWLSVRHKTPGGTGTYGIEVKRRR